jgi:hypothetical protein
VEQIRQLLTAAAMKKTAKSLRRRFSHYWRCGLKNWFFAEPPPYSPNLKSIG